MSLIKTNRSDLELIDPNVERDAPISVKWLAGDAGRNTLRLMGNNEEDNKPSTLELEKERVIGFINSKEQITWMISFKDEIVGAIWVDLKPTSYVGAPAMHIMIGDPKARGHGIGRSASEAVIGYMRQSGEYRDLYTRHLISNLPASKLLEEVGFTKLDETYTDSDGLIWQNEKLTLS